MVELRENYRDVRNSILNQRIEGTYLKPRPSSSYKTLLVLGIMNIGLGLSALINYFSVPHVHISYTEDLQQTIYLTKGTAYLYITVEGLYQNYLPYTKSINYDQIEGKTNDLNLNDTKPFDFLNGKPYYPAGAIAETFFQDKISLEGIKINSNDISWKGESGLIGKTNYTPSDIVFPESWSPETNRGTVPLNTQENSGLPILNERFANWISLAAFGNFSKLWGKMEIPSDDYYRLKVESNEGYYKSKGISISHANIMGIPNFYGYLCFIIIGLMCIMSGIYIKNHGY